MNLEYSCVGLLFGKLYFIPGNPGQIFTSAGGGTFTDPAEGRYSFLVSSVNPIVVPTSSRLRT
jgi:hypothetical protein